MAKTEEIMFQNVPYRPPVYKTGSMNNSNENNCHFVNLISFVKR